MEVPKVYSETDIKRMLLKTEGIQIIEQEKVDLPEALDYRGFESEYPKQTQHIQVEIEETAAACKDFLSGVIITDEFTDHLKRREWRHGMFDKYGPAFSSLYAKNKLRVNNLASVGMWLTTIAKAMDFYKVRSEKAEQLKAIVAQFPDFKDYEETSTLQEKLEFVKKVDEVCKSFLMLVSQRPEGPESV